MNKRIKRLWLKALRSGKYKQAREALRDGEAFCCLGVLCDLHSRTRNGGKWDDESYMGASGELPSAVIEWADLPDADPDVPHSTLSTLNDNGKDFNYIADRIEKYL